MQPRTIEEFVRWVLSEDPSLDEVDPDVKRQLEADYVSSLEDEITAALISALPDDKLGESEKLVDHGNMEELQKFIERNVPDAQDLISGVLLRFRNNYMSARDA